jgi:hypothetical protein
MRPCVGHTRAGSVSSLDRRFPAPGVHRLRAARSMGNAALVGVVPARVCTAVEAVRRHSGALALEPGSGVYTAFVILGHAVSNLSTFEFKRAHLRRVRWLSCALALAGHVSDDRGQHLTNDPGTIAPTIPVPRSRHHGNDWSRRCRRPTRPSARLGTGYLADLVGGAHRHADRIREPIARAAPVGLVVLQLRARRQADHPAMVERGNTGRRRTTRRPDSTFERRQRQRRVNPPSGSGSPESASTGMQAQDPKRRIGQHTGSGEPPLMKK